MNNDVVRSTEEEAAVSSVPRHSPLPSSFLVEEGNCKQQTAAMELMFYSLSKSQARDGISNSRLLPFSVDLHRRYHNSLHRRYQGKDIRCKK